MRIPFSLLFPALLAAFIAGVVLSSPFWSATGLAILTPSASSSQTAIPTDSLQAAFCPSPQCESLAISALDAAQERIDVAMYSFTNDALGDALVRAKERGVRVRVVLEKQQDSSSFSEHGKLSAAGISVRVDSNPQLMHHKFAVIDERFVITGSMNWSGNGVKENNENLLVIHSPQLNAQFAEEFEKIWGMSAE
ncbi:MAG: phospholipase D family protein [Candidatus Iainarchaeum archaeon]|uniref:Phospholipase D family protein n=1 Tax=Candidatus Iainarchaeum sp. TaxID=3101447 RepID=A0A7T9DJF9_9ARCH|nr:MAG: phospholipase D family protein [Candidatus Diapherotrites archaeon]